MLERSCGYIVGLVIICVGFVLLVIGFTSPFWVNVSLGDDVSEYSGLWQACASEIDNTKCVYLDISKARESTSTEWFYATRGLECIAVILYCTALIQAVTVNCSSFRNPQSKRVTSALSGIAGGFGLVGTIVYGAEVGDLHEEKYLSWSFALAIAGSCLAVIGSAVILFSNNKHEVQIPASQGVVIQANVPMQGVVQYPVSNVVAGQYPVETGHYPHYGFNPQNKHFDSQHMVDVSDVAPLYASR